MPVGEDNTAGLEALGGYQDEAPSSEAVDLATAAPLCTPAEFGALVNGLVTAEAPRLFAVVQELGTRVDVRVAAWGLAFEDFAEVIGVDRRICASLKSPERATRLFSRRPQITAHVEWVSPARPALNAES